MILQSFAKPLLKIVMQIWQKMMKNLDQQNMLFLKPNFYTALPKPRNLGFGYSALV